MVHNYASNEEWYFSWYLQELENAGFIHSIQYQPKPFKICDPATKPVKLYGKRKGWYEKEISLLQGSTYTADWLWYWTEKAAKIFFAPSKMFHFKDYPFIVNQRHNGLQWIFFSVIDVKGNFDPNNNVRMFSMNQKIIYEKYKIYVQGIVPKPSVKLKDKDGKKLDQSIIRPKSALFYSTFTPSRYLRTDGGKDQRLIHFEKRTINQFVDEQRNKLEALPGRV